MRQKLIMVLLLVGCSSGPIRSGFKIKLGPNEGVNDISKRFGLPPLLLLNANKGAKWRRGDLIFVPTKVGVLGRRDYFRQNYPADNRLLKQYFSRKLLWPVPSSSIVSSGYGKRRGKFHAGVDIPAKIGQKFVSADDGLVIFSSRKVSGYGKMVVVAHPKRLFTVYAHASKVYVSKGDKVFKGQYIGAVGNTGRSTGPHLHFEVRKSNRVLNPMHFLKRP